MGKGIFSSWFREFATLVFTQTVQAFLLAIVMSIIVSCLAGANGNGINAAGLLAIIALSSFSKIELLVKNIFGITSGYGDPSLRNGMGSLVGTAMAFRGFKNISDNAGKFIQGARLKKEGAAGLKALNANGGKLNADSSALNGITTDENGNSTDSLAQQTGSAVEEQVVKLQTLGDINALTNAIQRLTAATEAGNKTDTQSKMEKYQDMLNQGRDLQKTAIHESVGATIGGTAGAIVGLAQGDNIVSNALAGAGIGDSVGKGISDFGTENREYKKRMEKISKEAEKNYQASLDEIEAFKKEAAKNVSSGKVADVSQYNRAVVDAVNSYKQNIANNMKNAVPEAKRAPKSIRDSRNKLNEIQRNLDRRTNAGNN